MKKLLISLCVSCSLLFGMSAFSDQETGFLVTGSVTVDGGDIQELAVVIPATSAEILRFGNGVEIEIVAQTGSAQNAIVEVYVYRAINEKRQTLKHIRSIGPMSYQRSWSFAICGDQVASMSPAGAVSCLELSDETKA